MAQSVRQSDQFTCGRHRSLARRHLLCIGWSERSRVCWKQDSRWARRRADDCVIVKFGVVIEEEL